MLAPAYVNEMYTPNVPQHDQCICDHIPNTHPDRWPNVARHNVLHDKHDHAPRQTTRQQRKAQEQHQSRLPGHAIAAVTEAIGGQSRLVDRVDDQHAQCGADTRDPVDEGNVNGRVRRVPDRLGPHGYVDEGVESKGELGLHVSMETDGGRVRLPTMAPAV
jgi:hypothetical protein